jgi:hypothetical protein
VQLGGQVSSALEGSKLLVKVTQLLGCTRHATSAIAIQPYRHTRTFSTPLETSTDWNSQTKTSAIYQIQSNNDEPAAR